MSQLPPNPALTDLEPLVGEWDVEVPQFSGARGRVTSEWLAGGAYLRLSSESPGPAPDSMQIISRDDAGADYTVLYYDSRGVSRVYQMSFDGSVWKQWRQAPGFSQRFAATLSADGRTMTAAWEKSADDSTWEHDFDMIYTKRD